MVGWHSPTQWTCVWANSRRWWRTGKPGMVQFMGSQSHDLGTEQQQSQTLRNTALEQINIQIANYGATGFCWKLVVLVLVVQSCPTFCNPMERSPPGSSVHGILQARILEWAAMPFSRGSSWPRDWTPVSHIAGRFFTIWVIREVLVETRGYQNLSFHDLTANFFFNAE